MLALSPNKGAVTLSLPLRTEVEHSLHSNLSPVPIFCSILPQTLRSLTHWTQAQVTNSFEAQGAAAPFAGLRVEANISWPRTVL